MIRIESAAALIESFRPIDREMHGEALEVPGSFRFPMLVRDYVAWMEPSGARAFVVFADPGSRAPMGIVLRRDTSGATPPAICEWCHSTRGEGGIGLLTATASDKRRVGIHLCRDLACKERVEAAAEADSSFVPVSARDRVRRVVERMASFARRNLF